MQVHNRILAQKVQLDREVGLLKEKLCRYAGNFQSSLDARNDVLSIEASQMNPLAKPTMKKKLKNSKAKYRSRSTPPQYLSNGLVVSVEEDSTEVCEDSPSSSQRPSASVTVSAATAQKTQSLGYSRAPHNLSSPGHTLLPTSNKVKKLPVLNPSSFNPVDPEAIYLRVYALEKELQRHEKDVYFRLKEFALGEDSDVSYLDIQRFAEDTAKTLFHKRRISREFLLAGEEVLQSCLEELCFEVMYHKLFCQDDEQEQARNIKMQEKIFIYQNLMTPQLLGIEERHYSFNVYQLAFAGSN